MNNMGVDMYETFMKEECKKEQRHKEFEDEERSLLYPNANDEEYEEELMDQCFKED